MGTLRGSTPCEKGQCRNTVRGEGSGSQAVPTTFSRPINSPTVVHSAEENKYLLAVLCVNEHTYREHSRSQVLELKIYLFLTK